MIRTIAFAAIVPALVVLLWTNDPQVVLGAWVVGLGLALLGNYIDSQARGRAGR